MMLSAKTHCPLVGVFFSDPFMEVLLRDAHLESSSPWASYKVSNEPCYGRFSTRGSGLSQVCRQIVPYLFVIKAFIASVRILENAFRSGIPSIIVILSWGP